MEGIRRSSTPTRIVKSKQGPLRTETGRRDKTGIVTEIGIAIGGRTEGMGTDTRFGTGTGMSGIERKGTRKRSIVVGISQAARRSTNATGKTLLRKSDTEIMMTVIEERGKGTGDEFTVFKLSCLAHGHACLVSGCPVYGFCGFC